MFTQYEKQYFYYFFGDPFVKFLTTQLHYIITLLTIFLYHFPLLLCFYIISYNITHIILEMKIFLFGIICI